MTNDQCPPCLAPAFGVRSIEHDIGSLMVKFSLVETKDRDDGGKDMCVILLFKIRR